MHDNEKTAPDRNQAWRIDITGGVNDGASVLLDAGSYTIGGSLGNDIVLADPAVAGQHIRIEIGPDGARATPLAVGVSRRRRGLTTGHSVALRPGTTLRFGQTNIRLSGPAPRRRKFGWATIPAAALGIAGASFAAFQLATPNALAINPAHTASAQAKPADTGTAQRDFRDHLAAIGLADTITLAASSHVVTATGTLSPGDRGTWLAAQQWFDGQFGSRAVLVDRVGVAAKQDQPTLAIAAVSLMPIPHVITRDGEHYIEGAILPGGWAISAITRRAVTLTRGTRSVAIAL